MFNGKFEPGSLIIQTLYFDCTKQTKLKIKQSHITNVQINKFQTNNLQLATFPIQKYTSLIGDRLKSILLK